VSHYKAGDNFPRLFQLLGIDCGLIEDFNAYMKVVSLLHKAPKTDNTAVHADGGARFAPLVRCRFRNAGKQKAALRGLCAPSNKGPHKEGVLRRAEAYPGFVQFSHTSQATPGYFARSIRFGIL